jgi:hypothetical protein
MFAMLPDVDRTSGGVSVAVVLRLPHPRKLCERQQTIANLLSLLMVGRVDRSDLRIPVGAVVFNEMTLGVERMTLGRLDVAASRFRLIALKEIDVVARQLLQQAGLTLPVEVEFWYPTDVSRPYMPDPKRNFEAFAAHLNQAGFRITPRAAPWSPDYLGRAQEGNAGHLHLLGWTGDYGDPDNFIGTFFQTPTGQFGFTNQELHNLLAQAERETDEEARTGLYEDANRMIMEFLPAVPYAHTKPALAFNANVTGYTPSPVSLEPFSTVEIEE